MARLPTPGALGHDIATRHLVLGHVLTAIPQALGSHRAVRPPRLG